MTHLPASRLAGLAALLAALLAAAAMAATGAQGGGPPQPRIAVVVGARAAENATLVDRAEALAARAGAQVRVARTATEELSITHLLAIQRHDVIVGVRLDRRVSVAPVVRRYPRLRFVSAPDAHALAQAVERPRAKDGS